MFPFVEGAPGIQSPSLSIKVVLVRRGLDGAGLAVGIVREIGVRAERLGAVGLPIPVSPLVMRRPPPVLKKVSGLSQPETEKNRLATVGERILVGWSALRVCGTHAHVGGVTPSVSPRRLRHVSLRPPKTSLSISEVFDPPSSQHCYE